MWTEIFHTNKNILSFWAEITNNFIIPESIFNQCWKYQLRLSSHYLWRQSKKLFLFSEKRIIQFLFIADGGPILLEKFTTSKTICMENSVGVFTVLEFSLWYNNTNTWNTGYNWMAKTNVLIGYVLLYNLKINNNI